MKILDLLDLSCVDVNVSAKSKDGCIKQAVAMLGKSGKISDLDIFEKGVFEREKLSTTGVGNFIAIPHCKSDCVKEPALAAMIIKDGVD